MDLSSHTIAQAKNHWVIHGINEGRYPFCTYKYFTFNVACGPSSTTIVEGAYPSSKTSK